MSQSSSDARFATDETFTGGTYDGLPTKVEPSSGLKASGYVPGTFLPFPRLNWQLNAIGNLIDGLADICAVNWGPVGTTLGTNVEGRILHEVQHKSVATFSQTLLLTGADDYLISLDDDTSCIIFTTDLRTWTISPNPSTFGLPQRGPVLGSNAGALTVVVFDISTGAVKRTTDGGNTWPDAGTLSGNGGLGTAVGTYLQSQGRWIIFAQGTIHTSDDLADEDWTLATVPTEYGTPLNPTCVAAGADGVLIGTTASALGGMIYSADGLTFQFVALGDADQVASVTYSPSRRQWFAVTLGGKVWSAPTGAQPWTLLADLSAITPKTIHAFGRALVVGGDRLLASRDGGGTWRLVGPYPTPTFAWHRILPFAGSALALGFIGLGDDDASWSRSLVAPFDLGDFVP